MARKPPTFSNQIRLAVDVSGLSRYRIAKEIGIAESGMSRFMNGAGLGMDTLDRLAALLGLKVVVEGRRSNPGK